MPEPQPQNPNYLASQEGLKSFGELLARPEIIYHGIGADLMALQGIVTHGVASIAQQIEFTGDYNGNTPRDAAWNSHDKVSVAEAPRSGLPNLAFMTYIESSPISFAIDSTMCTTEQPAGRGLFDEAFISGAPNEAIAGIVLDGITKDKPIVEIPIVGELTTAEKARGFMNFLIKNYDLGPEAAEMPELENFISGIHYTTLQTHLWRTMALYSREPTDSRSNR